MESPLFVYAREDGKTFALASADRTVSLWQSKHARRTRILGPHESAVWCVAFSPDGRLLAAAGADGTIALWDVETGRSRGILAGHRHAVRSVLFCTRTGVLVSADAPLGGEASVRVFSLPEGDGRLFALVPTAVLSVALSPDGRTLAAASRDGAVRPWPWVYPGQRQVGLLPRRTPAAN
jgi:WD40 repeat protein